MNSNPETFSQKQPSTEHLILPSNQGADTTELENSRVSAEGLNDTLMPLVIDPNRISDLIWSRDTTDWNADELHAAAEEYGSCQRSC